MCPKIYSAYLVYSRAEKKQHDSDEEKEKMQQKTTFENDSDDCYSQYTKMGSNNNDIPDGLSIVDKYVQIAINKLHLLKYFNI